MFSWCEWGINLSILCNLLLHWNRILLHFHQRPVFTLPPPFPKRHLSDVSWEYVNTKMNNNLPTEKDYSNAYQKNVGDILF